MLGSIATAKEVQSALLVPRHLSADVHSFPSLTQLHDIRKAVQQQVQLQLQLQLQVNEQGAAATATTASATAKYATIVKQSPPLSKRHAMTTTKTASGDIDINDSSSSSTTINPIKTPTTTTSAVSRKAADGVAGKKSADINCKTADNDNQKGNKDKDGGSNNESIIAAARRAWKEERDREQQKQQQQQQQQQSKNGSEKSGKEQQKQQKQSKQQNQQQQQQPQKIQKTRPDPEQLRREIRQEVNLDVICERLFCTLSDASAAHSVALSHNFFN